MSGTRNNRELYKDVFSRLHASENCIMEEINMKQVRSKVRLSRLAAACISAALLIGAMSGLSYAATGGETINPITAVKVYINGKAVDADMMKNEDGSFTVHIDEGDRLDIEGSDGSSGSIQLCETGETGGADVSCKSDGNFGDMDVTILEPDGSDGNTGSGDESASVSGADAESSGSGDDSGHGKNEDKADGAD